MFDKVILENGGMLLFITDCCNNKKIWKICDKAVDNYSHALKFVLECYKTQNMCGKTVNTSPSSTQFVRDCHKTQEMYDKAVITSDWNKTPRIYDEFVSKEP